MGRRSESRAPAIQQAREAQARGDVDRAISILGKAAEANPNDGQILYEYAWALVRSGHDDAAIPVLIYSLGVEPLLRASVELLSNVLKNMVITKWEGRIPDELAVAFREDVDHQPFSKTSLAILGMHEPLSAAYAMGRDRGWNAAAKWFLCSKE